MSSSATGSSRLSCRAGRKCRCSHLGGVKRYSRRFAYKSLLTAASMMSIGELHDTWLTFFRLLVSVGGYGMVMVDAMGPLVGAHILHCLLMIGSTIAYACQPNSAQASWAGEYVKSMRDPPTVTAKSGLWQGPS